VGQETGIAGAEISAPGDSMSSSFNCDCRSIVIAERIVHHDRCAVLAKSCIPADMITMVMDIDQMKP